ncbi:hypothetical protein D3C87_1340530 [compost metagenome]
MSVTSATKVSAFPPSSLICFFTLSILSSALDTRTMLAPALANLKAVAAPIPEDAPVIMVTKPFNF